MNKPTPFYDASGYLSGHIILASPFSEDDRLKHAVIYICGHDENGAMGLMLNQPLNNLKSDDVLKQLNLPMSPDMKLSIVTGGTTDGGRGFVLHSAEYKHPSTIEINDEFSLTATLDILQNISKGDGPSHSVLALGYMAWEKKKLEEEITQNTWFVLTPTPDFVFHTRAESMWDEGMKHLHISPASLVMEGGKA